MRKVLLLLVAAAALLVPASPAAAACGAGPMHVCDSGDTGLDTQLRTVVANAAPGSTVAIDAGTNPTLALAQPDIAINKNLTIEGQGPASTTITGSAVNRVFNIGSVTPGITVTISGLTVSGGHAPKGANGSMGLPNGKAGGDGGGILNAGTLNLSTVLMSGNHAGNGGNGAVDGPPGFEVGVGGTGGMGGAVANTATGVLSIAGSELMGNGAGSGGVAATNINLATGGSGAAGGDGGAIHNELGGIVTITDSTIATNQAGDGGNGADFLVGGNGGVGAVGGGVASSGSLTISETTVAMNQGGAGGTGGDGSGGGGGGGSGGAGGGIAASSMTTLTNFTLASNIAGGGGAGGNGTGAAMGGNGGGGGSGGGLVFFGGSLTLTHATVAVNQAPVGGAAGAGPGGSGVAGLGGVGGGLAGSSPTLRNSLVVSNTAPLAAAGNCSGSPTDGGHNLSYPDMTGCPGGTPTDPMLNPLSDNGGPTETIGLDPASAALDAVPAVGANCPVTDQREITRPQGVGCDIGAFESRAARPVITSTNPPSPGDSTEPLVIGKSGEGTVRIYPDAACTASELATGTSAAFASAGIPVSVSASSTTPLYAETTSSDGTSLCSNGFVYTTPVPQTPPPNSVASGSVGSSGASGSGTTGQQAAALDKCKKKKGKARKKCKKKAIKLPA